MPTAFPGAVDDFENPGVVRMDSPLVPHSAQHANANDAIEAVEQFVLDEADALDAVEAALADKADLVGGVVPDEQIPATVTRDSELAAAVADALSGIVDGAPAALDTLNELAAAVNDDASFAASVTTALASKAATDLANVIAGAVVTALIGDGQVTPAKLSFDPATQAELDAVSAFAVPLFARKTADESVSNSSAFQADDHLLVAVAANAVYQFDLVVFYDAPTTGDIRFRFAVPAGADVRWAQVAPQNAATNFSNVGANLVAVGDGAASNSGGVGGAGVGTKGAYTARGLVVVGGTAGSLALEWGPVASDPAAATVYTGSFLVARRVA